MSKTLKVTIGVISVVGILATVTIFSFDKYNQIIKKDEAIKVSWSQVESNIKRKFDLIPNLVRVVKGYAKHEEKVFTKVVAIRNNKELLEKLKPTDSTNMNKLQNINSSLTKSLLSISAVAESYPELKASEQFLTLQSQLEGTENRINITRMNYNQEVNIYNSYIKQIPNNIIANYFKFTEKPYFEVEKIKKSEN